MDKYLNQIIGDYKVLKRLDKTYYEVQCIKCGIQTKLSMQTLRDAKKHPENRGICNCTRSGIKPGDVFGRLTVLYRDIENQPYGRITWLCRCECGNIISVTAKDLKSGNKQSCGCLARDSSIKNISKTLTNLEDLTGQRSGNLTVIRLATENEKVNRPKGLRYWYCKCDCGNSHIVSTSDFKLGKVQSCGCLNSKGEALISSLLENNKINYARQFYFDDLISENGRKFYFDFGILNNNNQLLYLIEYDGIQHFSIEHQFSKDLDALEIIKIRDNTKNNYCKEHGIPLIRIPYTHKEIKIEDLLLETTSFRKE